LEEVGKVLLMAKSGHVIIKVDRWIKPGTILFDSEGRKLAKVTELIGPVKFPYITGIPLSEKLDRKIGHKVMITSKTKNGVRIGSKK